MWWALFISLVALPLLVLVVEGGRYFHAVSDVQKAADAAAEAAVRDLTVISGLALGIDTAGHCGPIETGRTIALLGSGIRHIHPRENVDLAEQIEANGGILSELHPNTPPKGQNLMARDRIISELSRAVIVVEAGEKSGSLDTASKAIKQGQPVYAVPGSAGTDQLLAGRAHRLDPSIIDFDRLAAELNKPPEHDERSALQQSSFW